MDDLFYPALGTRRSRPIRIRQEMALSVPRVGGGLGRIVPRNVEEYPGWMFTGRVPRSDLVAGTHYEPGALQPLALPLRDPRRWQNIDTRSSRDIAQGATLNETHVNLESNIGQYFKQAWDLPYQAHSRVDDQYNAVWAERFTGLRNRVHAAFGERIGGNVLKVAQRLQQGDLLHQSQTEVVDAWLQNFTTPEAGELFGLLGLKPEASAAQAFRTRYELGEAEKEALVQYQKSASINDHLRGGRLRGSSHKISAVYGSEESTQTFIHHLDRATSSQAAAEPTVVWRGLRADPELREQLRVGKRYIERGYTSTTFDPRVTAAFREDVNQATEALLLRIHVPKGLQASAQLAQKLPGVGTGQEEAETLLRRGTPLRIISEEAKDGYTLVVAKALRSVRARRLPVRAASVAEAATPSLLKDGLQQLHVNLESETGQFLKRVMKLPFRKHSRLDVQEAALQAFRSFQQGPAQFFSAASQFSEMETAALARYKGFGFSSINQALRGDPASLSVEGRQVVDHLDQLTHAGQVEREFSVHRGFRHPALAGEGSLVGKEFGDAGFVSTSLNPYVPDEFARSSQDFTAEIKLKRGSKGFLLSSHEAWRQGDKEAEFILPRETRFKVLEEHAAESAFRPRHLVLEAITPEHQPTPVQLGRQIAHEVQPTAGAAAATAERLTMKETENALHVNLESSIGQFVKKLFQLPFKPHSRVDPLAAATSTAGFSPHGFTGILMAGGILAGSLWALNRRGPTTSLAPSPQATPPAERGATEGSSETVTHRPGPNPAYQASTTLELADSPLDHERLDRAFAHHLNTGFALA